MPSISLPEKAIEQIALIAREQALKNDVIDSEVLEKYDAIQTLNREYFAAKLEAELALQKHDTTGSNQKFAEMQAKFDAGLAASEKLNAHEKSQIGNYIAYQTNAMSAAANFERARSFLLPKDRFKTYLRDGMLNSGDAKAFLTRTRSTIDKMIISTVFTIHPTLWDTEFGRELQKGLTEDLEMTAGRMPFKSDAKSFLLPAGTVKKITQRLSEASRKLVSGKADLTPMKKVTIPMENKGERNFSDAAHQDMNSVITAWNDAVNEIMADKTFVMDVNRKIADSVLKIGDGDFTALQIDDQRRAKIIEFRTWGLEADADGRDASTSPGLSQWIRDDIKKGRAFVTRDMRDNSSQLIDVVSALIQTNYHRSKHQSFGAKQDFYEHCIAFARQAQKKHQITESWQAADKSVLQQLTREAQSEFLQGLITKASEAQNKEHFQLVPQETRHHTLEFCDFFYDELKSFIASKKEEGYELPDSTTFDQLAKFRVSKGQHTRHLNLQTEFIERIVQKDFFAENGAGKIKYHYLLGKEGYYQANLDDKARDFLEGRVRIIKKDGKEIQKPLDEKERRLLMDVVKRLIVADDAIDKYGQKVADRYQIANFEDPSHFYALMLLMQQTGIMNIENGEVKSSKIAIQPLIETAEDRDNAPDIFRKLLSEELGNSYFHAISKQKGYVEIMIGFSDGAATGGNFASEWGMYKCMKDVSEVFAKEGIKVRYFKGRGRGDDRGGQHEAGLDMTTVPERSVEMAISDVTRQSDLPQHGYISKTYDEDMYASSMLGVLSARDRLLTRSETEKKQQESYERACQFIAERAEKHYFKMVRKRADGEQLAFFDAMPQNPDITTRAAKRAMADGVKIEALSLPEKTEVFDKTRAITKEYRQRIAGLPSYEAGLKEALSEYLAESKSNRDIQVLSKDKTGKDIWLKGDEALENMYEHFGFFHTITDKTHLNIREGYDPIRAKAYGEKTGCKQFVGDICESANGLLPLLDEIRGPMLGVVPRHEQGRLYNITPATHTQLQYASGARNVSATQGMLKQLAQTSHFLMLSNDMKDWYPPKGDEALSEKKRAMRNCLFVASVAGLQQGLHAQNDVTLQMGASQPSVMAR